MNGKVKNLVSEKQKKRWNKFLEEYAEVVSLRLSKLLIDEYEFEAKMRRKTLRMARKRRLKDYVR